MIALLIGLLLLFTPERIYTGAFAHTDQLEQVVSNRGWQGTQDFDLLLATENCTDLARWAWVIAGGKVYDALIVDCARPEHRQQMIDRGIVADVNKPGLGSGFLIVR